ncbi:MAG TPA: hypothetical protein DIU15_03925 [Deltaproteobacteria bacterium]|nr:hypothetical protein [Deltaproteobacteria bacterium]HCP45162.1 hypothetical protein [Deltaproteobacteria bacterium]
MQILCPVNSPEEVAPLVDAGADEFYCGLFPTEWYEKWGRGSWPNRRGPGPANISKIDDLARLADSVHTAGSGGPNQRRVPLFVALNQQFYPDDQADFLLGIAQDLQSRSAVDAFIVSDPGFMGLLKTEIPEARVFSSTVSVATNAQAVRFLADLGCSRVILSRHLHLAEVESLQQSVPDVELEVFLLNDNCYFEEGFCSTTHTMPGFGVYCMTPWELRVTRDDQGGQGLSDPEERARWDFLIDEHRRFLGNLSHRGFGGGRAAVPLGPCGLCAIPKLMDLGIHSGKIVGREASLYRKIRSVQSVRYVRDSYRETGDAQEAKKKAVELRADPRGCSSGMSCYYRSARDRDLIPLPSRSTKKPTRNATKP